MRNRSEKIFLYYCKQKQRLPLVTLPHIKFILTKLGEWVSVRLIALRDDPETDHSIIVLKSEINSNNYLIESWNILEILPPEIMILVFGHLDPEDIVSSLSVSKLWNAFHINFNWKNAFTATFGELSSSVDLSQKFNWRQMVSIITRFFIRKLIY